LSGLEENQERYDHDEAVFAKLGERLRKSDQAAFSDLFEAMHTALLHYSHRYTGNREAARDIVQDAFLKVWRVRESIDPSRSLRGLLYTIVRNLSLNYRRSARHVADDGLPEYGIKDDATSPEEQLDHQMLQNRIKQFIDELPPRRRQAFMLSRYSGMSHKEIAAEMNLTPRTVNTHIVLALRTLRARVEALQTDGSHET